MKFENKICRLYNDLIPLIIPDHSKRSSNLINVEATAGYGTLHMHYIFNHIESIKVGSSLHNQILFTLDKFFNWCDLTEFGDNKLIIHIHNVSKNRIERLTYFELMNACYTIDINNHPKFNQFLIWKTCYEQNYQKAKIQQILEQDYLERIRMNQDLLLSL